MIARFIPYCYCLFCALNIIHVNIQTPDSFILSGKDTCSTAIHALIFACPSKTNRNICEYAVDRLRIIQWILLIYSGLHSVDRVDNSGIALG